MGSFPQPPSPQSRLLLQVIWDFAQTRSTWPTLIQLEQRLKQAGHEHIDAWDVLGQIPVGLVSKVQSRSEMDLSGGCIGLTVAGAAACTGTEGVLTALVQFTHAAAEVDAGQSLGAGKRSQRELSFPLDEFIRDAGLPSVGDADLLRKLRLLLQVQPCGWEVFEDPKSSGHWRVTFDGRAWVFHGVADIQDYWMRLPENRQVAPTFPVEELASTPEVAEFRRLAGQVYAGLHDGIVPAETAFDLAYMLLDAGYADSLARELAEQSAEGSDPEKIARLARQTLEAVRFEPDFDMEPRLLVRLQHALEMTKADLRPAGLWGVVGLVVVDGTVPRHAHVTFRGPDLRK